MSEKLIEEKKIPVKPLADDLRAKLVEAVTKGNFKKAARLRKSIANIK